jgi:hypothetical protein
VDSFRQRKEHTMTAASTSTVNRRQIRYVAGATITATALAGGAAILCASSADAATTALIHGSCSMGSTVSMQLQHSDPGRIDAGFEVDHAKVGSTWRVRLQHDGVRYFLGTRTAAADGTFSVDRVLRNLPGPDTFTGHARNLASGEVCKVTGQI